MVAGTSRYLPIMVLVPVSVVIRDKSLGEER